MPLRWKHSFCHRYSVNLNPNDGETVIIGNSGNLMYMDGFVGSDGPTRILINFSKYWLDQQWWNRQRLVLSHGLVAQLFLLRLIHLHWTYCTWVKRRVQILSK